MAKFSIAIEIAAPRERVRQVMSDIERWHEWTASIKSVKRLSAGPFAVGNRVLIRQPKLPPAFWKVVAIEPGRSFTWISVAPGFRAIGYHAVESNSDVSRATLSIEFKEFSAACSPASRKASPNNISALRQMDSRRAARIPRSGAAKDTIAATHSLIGKLLPARSRKGRT
jgi:hypothetical protein